MSRFTFLGTRGLDVKAWKYRLAYLLDKLPSSWGDLFRLK